MGKKEKNYNKFIRPVILRINYYINSILANNHDSLHFLDERTRADVAYIKKNHEIEYLSKLYEDILQESIKNFEMLLFHKIKIFTMPLQYIQMQWRRQDNHYICLIPSDIWKVIFKYITDEKCKEIIDLSAQKTKNYLLSFTRLSLIDSIDYNLILIEIIRSKLSKLSKLSKNYSIYMKIAWAHMLKMMTISYIEDMDL